MYGTSSKTHAEFKTAKHFNEHKRCSAPGCTEYRDGLNSVCRAHLAPLKRYGHPLATPVRLTEYRAAVDKASRLIAANPSHPGLSAAAAWLQSQMDAAAREDTSVAGWEEWARLKRHGVSPQDILSHVAGCFVFLAEHPHRLPDDASRSFALARAMLALAPRPRRALGNGATYSPRAKPSSVSRLAKLLQAQLAPLLANIARTVREMPSPEAARGRAMSAPLQLPAPVL